MIKNWEQFNEAKKEVRKKEHLMTDSKRKSIVRKAKRMIKSEVKDYDDQPVGKREGILDDYIEKVCKELGYDIHNFYGTDGKKLSQLLGWD